MNVSLTHTHGRFGFEARNARGAAVQIDAGPASGGEGRGASPMELVAMAMAGCSGIDILSILEKMRQEPTAFAADVEAVRASEGPPAVFTEVVLRYRLEGPLDPEKVRHAVRLSLERYCSVSKMIEKTAVVSWTIHLNGADITAE